MFKVKSVSVATLFSGEKVDIVYTGSVNDIEAALDWASENLHRLQKQMIKGETIYQDNRQINLAGVSMLDYHGTHFEPEKNAPRIGGVFIDKGGNYIGPFFDETFTAEQRKSVEGQRGTLFSMPEGVSKEDAFYVTGLTPEGTPACVAFPERGFAERYHDHGGINNQRKILTYDELASDLPMPKTNSLWRK